MKSQSLIRGFAALAALLSCVLAWAQSGGGFSLQARVEPSSAQVGETVVYSITVTSPNQQPPSPQLPQMNPAFGFSTPKFVSSRQATFITNGSISLQFEYRYEFQVTKPGTFDIPSAVVNAGGSVFKSNTVKFTVAAVNAARANELPAELRGWVVAPQVPGNPQLQRQLDGAIFVLPIPETTKPFAGQQFVLGFHLCIDQDVLTRAGLLVNNYYANKIEMPELKQFIKDEIYPTPNTLRFRERVFGGKQYMVAPLYQAAITPTKTGKLKIEPFKLAVWFNSRRNEGRSRDPFADDPFFSDDPFMGMSPFGSANRVQIVASSPEIEVDVRPLPTQDRPADFTGAVGDFKMSAIADRNTATAGEDVVKYELKVEGNGNASALSPPQLSKSDEFAVLEDPKVSTDRRVENDQIVSIKKFEYILRPLKAGHVVVPPVAMSVFNPKTQQYGTIESNPIGLDVKQGSTQVALVSPQTAGSNQQADQRSAEPPQPKEQDLRYIHDGALQAVEPGTLTGDGPLFMILIILPPVLVVAGFLVGRRRAAVEADPSRFRRAAAAAVARRHLKSVAKLLEKDDRDTFFGELGFALRRYFGDKFRLDPSSLTVEQIREELQKKDVVGEDIQSVTSLLEQCDSARYSPAKPEHSVMRTAYDEAARLLTVMEKVK